MEGAGEAGSQWLCPSSMQWGCPFFASPSRYLCEEGTPTETQALERREAAILGLLRQQGCCSPSEPGKRKSSDSRWRGKATVRHPHSHHLALKFWVGFLGVTRMPRKVAGLRDTEGHIMRGSIYVKYPEQANS